MDQKINEFLLKNKTFEISNQVFIFNFNDINETYQFTGQEIEVLKKIAVGDAFIRYEMSSGKFNNNDPIIYYYLINTKFYDDRGNLLICATKYV